MLRKSRESNLRGEERGCNSGDFSNGVAGVGAAGSGGWVGGGGGGEERRSEG